MKKLMLLALVGLLAMPIHAGADVKMKRLGEDPVGDAPAGLDLTYVEAGKNGPNLEIRIGVEGMTPGTGGYPLLPGIEWLFTTGKRSFLAEAYVDAGQPGFLLFEILEDSYKQIAEIEGTYEWTDGYISLLVPLKDIDAKRGTKIRAALEEGDADSHVHLGSLTEYPDYLTTTKAFVVP